LIFLKHVQAKLASQNNANFNLMGVALALSRLFSVLWEDGNSNRDLVVLQEEWVVNVSSSKVNGGQVGL